MSALKCVKCGANIGVFYTDPLSYVCDNNKCSQAYRDADDPGIRTLTQDQARAKRPAMFGMPTCVKPGCCTHQPHGEKCLVCEEEKVARSRVPRLVPITSHVRRKP